MANGKRRLGEDVPAEDNVSRFDYAHNRQAYINRINSFINASRNPKKRWDPFIEIDWKSPDNDIKMDDERWILPKGFDIGAHPWYQALPVERQIEIGLYRYAHTCTVGWQFEQALVEGIMSYASVQPKESREARYAIHEATEETHHIQMFREFVQHTGVDTKGAPTWFLRAADMVKPVARRLPVGFWTTVLAGEEPIDYTQQLLIEQAKDHPIHPLIHKVMEIHIKEEARHISFAETYLKRHVHKDKMSRMQRLALTALYPFVMRVAADVILRPSKEAIKDMGIPAEVAKEVWWDSNESQEFFQELFLRSRKLADELGIRGRMGRAAWRMAGLEKK